MVQLNREIAMPSQLRKGTERVLSIATYEVCIWAILGTALLSSSANIHLPKPTLAQLLLHYVDRRTPNLTLQFASTTFCQPKHRMNNGKQRLERNLRCS